MHMIPDVLVEYQLSTWMFALIAKNRQQITKSEYVLRARNAKETLKKNTLRSTSRYFIYTDTKGVHRKSRAPLQ